MTRIRYNSPVILTFSIIAVLIQVVDSFIFPSLTLNFFVVRPSMSWSNPVDYFRMTSHVLGHGGWNHIIGNMTYVLLLGPILEEKYGSTTLLIMIVITAISTGLINVLFFATGLLGASGIVFMLIILASISDFKKGTIPLTFLLVAAIFIGSELLNIFRNDQISQVTHIIGGTCGAVFGFIASTTDRKSEKNGHVADRY